MHTQLAIEKFLLDCRARGLSPKTIRRYSDDLKRLSRHLTNPACPIHYTTGDELRNLFANLHERKLSSFSIEGIYRSLSAFFHFCLRESLLADNPLAHIKKPKLPKRIIPRLNEHEAQLLLNAIRETQSPDRNTAIILLMLDSGLRRNEVIELKSDDVKKNFVKVIGKGKREREVPIGSETRKALRAWTNSRPSTLDTHIFINDDGKPLSESAIASLFRRLKKKLKFTRLYPHLLRHTFAKMYLRHGDPKSLSQILGHAKISTTLDIYVDWEISELITIHHRASPMRFIRRSNRFHTHLRK